MYKFIYHDDPAPETAVTPETEPVSEPEATPDNVAGPEGMKSVTYTDPATGHGVTLRVVKSISTERIYTWASHEFANPVPMYEKPLTLKPGEKLELEYEVKVF